MTTYINPPGETKEDFLARCAKEVPGLSWDDVPEGFAPVVWVNNGWMTAAGVCGNRQEFEAFLDPNDRRPKRTYLVEKSALEGVCPDFFPPGVTLVRAS